MATQALYRIWRPTTFSDVHGQDAAIITLKNQVASGRVSHAYLFCGSRGTGKTTTAKIFARAVNCESPTEGNPCGACPTCLALQADNNLDIVEIDAASNNGVDEIRDLRDKIKYPPQHGKYRVYIIDEVHMLSTGAFNALLKTLEEPPAHALFILATTEPQRLPATVLSRVQRYDFRRIPAHIIVQRLRTIVDGEHGDATEEALMLVARSAEGGMRDAISLLDMALSYGGGSVDAALVREMLGAADRGFLFAFAGYLINGDASGALRAIDELMRGGREVLVFARDITGHLRALLLAKTVGDALADLLDLTEEDAAQYREQAARISRERLLPMLDLFLSAETDMKWSVQPRTALEVAAVRACLPEETLRLDALASRLDLLEQKAAQGIAISPPQAAPSKEKKPSHSTPKAAPSPAKPADTATPTASDIWDRAKALFRKNAKLNAFIMQGKFDGIEGDTVRLVYPQTAKIFVDILRQEERKSVIENILAEAAGRPMTLSVALETPSAVDAKNAVDLQQQVFDAFGRENVQVVDTIDGENR